MTISTVMAIMCLVIALAIIGAEVYFYVRDKSLAEIREDVYLLFVEVEKKPEFYKAGKQKMKWVLARARSLLPAWLQMFITDAFLERVIEGWFQAVKDLLDDGKLNDSTEEENADE